MSPDRLRVLHLRNSDLLGGPERLLLDQVERAERDASAVGSMTLASFGPEGAPHPFLDEARRRGLPTRLVPQTGAYDRRLVARVRALLSDVRPHVVVGHDYKANVLLRRAALPLGLPWVAVVHGYTAENVKVRLFEWLDRRALRHAAAVVTVSEAGRAQVLAAGVAPERVALIANGIDVRRVAAAAREAGPDLRAQWGFTHEHLVLLALGRLSPEKGHRVLLTAWRSFPPTALPHARLVLVGDGSERPALEALAASDPRVSFAGWRSDPHACLGAADVFVLPSLREGLPLALLEAMACGLPSVASAVGAVPTALAQGAAGRLVPPGSAPALAAALEELAHDPSLRARLGAAAAERAAAAYDDADQAAALVGLYASLRR